MESVQKRRAVNMEEMKFEELTELKEPEEDAIAAHMFEQY